MQDSLTDTQAVIFMWAAMSLVIMCIVVGEAVLKAAKARAGRS